MSDNITVLGYKGTSEELAKLLSASMHIISVTPQEAGFVIEYETKAAGRQQKINKGTVLKLRSEGEPYSVIAKKLGCSKAYVIKVCKAAAAKEQEKDSDLMMDINPTKIVDAKEIKKDNNLEKSLIAAEKQCKSLKELRKAAGLSQKSLSEVSGVKLRIIQEYERGQRDVQNGSEIIRYYLAKALNCRPEDIGN